MQILCCSLHTGWIKTRPAQKLLVGVKFTGNPYRTYRTRINVNGRHWNTCKLGVSWNPYTGTRTRTRVYVNEALLSVRDCAHWCHWPVCLSDITGCRADCRWRRCTVVQFTHQVTERSAMIHIHSHHSHDSTPNIWETGDSCNISHKSAIFSTSNNAPFMRRTWTDVAISVAYKAVNVFSRLFTFLKV